MRNKQQPYQAGRAIEYNEEPELERAAHFTDATNKPRTRGPYRAGTIDSGTGVHMEEGEEPGGIADKTDKEVKATAMEDFANKIKKVVSAKLMGKQINLKLKGHPDIVSQVTNMINLEADYLAALMSGQAVDTPALQKNKAVIEMEAKKLDRMMATSDFWPFK